MTTATVFRAADGTIVGFEVSGHTGYAPQGEDIVCAAVSALSQATLNGLVNVLKAPVDYEIDEQDARMTVRLVDAIVPDKRAGAQLLLQTFVQGLESIQSGYPRFIRVIYKKRRESTCSE